MKTSRIIKEHFDRGRAEEGSGLLECQMMKKDIKG